MFENWLGRRSRISDGKLHEKLALFPGLIAVLIIAIISVKYPLAIWALLGVWAGVYLVTPDADLAAITRSETRWFNESHHILINWLHHLVGLSALSLSFWPGQLLKHRGISHTPIIGSLVILILMIPSLPGIIIVLLLRNNLIVFFPIWCGLVYAHFIHIVVDFVISGIKKTVKRVRYGR